MQKCTPLEKRILWSRAKILLFWLWWILCYVFMFWYHWILGVLVLTASIFLRFITAWERNYFFSKEDYFKKYARSHSWEERLELSEESEKNGKYITIGEAVFLEEFVLLTKLGAVLNYREIHHFSYQESKTKSGLPKHYFNIYFVTNEEKEYHVVLENSPHLFEGHDCLYQQACKLLMEKKQTNHF